MVFPERRRVELFLTLQGSKMGFQKLYKLQIQYQEMTQKMALKLKLEAMWMLTMIKG